MVNERDTYILIPKSSAVHGLTGAPVIQAVRLTRVHRGDGNSQGSNYIRGSLHFGGSVAWVVVLWECMNYFGSGIGYTRTITPSL